MSTTTSTPVVRDPRGLRWTRIPAAAERTGARAGTVRVWVHRGIVRSQTVDRERWVCLDDVEDACRR